MTGEAHVIDVVCFKWKPALGYRSTFGPETVNVLKRMVNRHYATLHRFTCVTDDPAGLDPDVRVVPLWDDLADVPSPMGGTRKNPSCYRRLKLFSAEAAELIGPRFVALDLDCVITGDLAPLWDRPEDFIIWGGTHPRTQYNGSMMLMTAGARRQVWETFDPVRSPRATQAARCYGSDQAWISYCLGPEEKRWSCEEGVHSYRHLQDGRLPANARMVLFPGAANPWSPDVQAQHEWVRRCWA